MYARGKARAGLHVSGRGEGRDPWEGGGGGEPRPGVWEPLKTAGAEPSDAGEGARRTGSRRWGCAGGPARERE